MDPALFASPLRRGRPAKASATPAFVAEVPALLSTVPPVDLEVADWAALLARAPDPRRATRDTPREQICRREVGADGRVRLRWEYLHDNQEFEARRNFAKQQGGQWTCEFDHFNNRGSWKLTPEAADACMRQFKLVDLSPCERLVARYDGWEIQLIGCAPHPAPKAYAIAVVDFEAARIVAAADPAAALGLALWLEAQGGGRAWYRLRGAAGEHLPAGALVSEPLLAAELDGSPLSEWRERGLRVVRLTAPGPLRAAWAAVPLRGIETAEGLVRPEPHPGCPGHRLGGLLPAWLRAQAKGREALLLLRAEWDGLVERAKRLGVPAELTPRPRPAVALAFNPARLPGWDEHAPAARCGHRLFPFQQDSVRFALEADLKAILGDEMGLGKTATTVATAIAAERKRVLVVCPLNALGVWRREVAAWSAADGPEPIITVVRATGERPELPDAGWVLVTYETLAGRDERLGIKREADLKALTTFLTARLGDGTQESSGWSVREVWAPTAGPKSAHQLLVERRKTRWEFTLCPEPKVAEAVADLVRHGAAGWEPEDGELRPRLARTARRLARPVATALQAWGPDLLVADEAHRLKNPTSRRTHAVREFAPAGRRVLLLTGTPLRNHAADGKALLEVILPERVWAAMGRSGEEVKAVVKDLLARRMVRRLKCDVLTQLPPKLRQRVPVPMTGRDLHDYAEAMGKAEAKFRETLEATGSLSDARKAALPMWSVARRLFGLAKLESGVPIELIAQVVAEKGAVIVFAHHRDVLDGLEKSLREKKLTVGRVDGQVGPAERARVEADFQAGRLQVFLGGILAAGEAITLTRADTVVFVELAWVPGELLQAEDRGHRAGQQAKGYHVIHLTAQFDREAASALAEEVNADGLPLEELAPAEDLRRWRQCRAAAAEAVLEAAVENIDEHMIGALDAKVAHINQVLGEAADRLVATSEEDGPASGLSRLAQATEQRVRPAPPGR